MASRIAHFTDLHFTEPPKNIPFREILSKRILGWLNLRFLGRASAFADTATVVQSFIGDLERMRPDYVVFTGDVTGLSLRSEYETARKALAPLLRDGRVTGIPGNHDVYVRQTVREDFFQEYFGDWTRTDLQPEDFPEHLREPYPYPLLRFLGEEAALFCLYDVRSTMIHDSSGKVHSVQLRALDHLLRRADVQKRIKILSLHYALRLANGSPDSFLHRLQNADEVLALAEERQVDLLIHGHVHHRYVHPQGTLSSVAMANPGSLSHNGGEQAYHIYTVDRKQIHLEARRYDPSTGDFRPWPQAPWSGKICG